MSSAPNGIRSSSWKVTPYAPSPASRWTVSTGSRARRVASPKGSRPCQPTVHRPKLNLSSGTGRQRIASPSVISSRHFTNSAAPKLICGGTPGNPLEADRASRLRTVWQRGRQGREHDGRTGSGTARPRRGQLDAVHEDAGRGRGDRRGRRAWAGAPHGRRPRQAERPPAVVAGAGGGTGAVRGRRPAGL